VQVGTSQQGKMDAGLQDDTEGRMQRKQEAMAAGATACGGTTIVAGGLPLPSRVPSPPLIFRLPGPASCVSSTSSCVRMSDPLRSS